MMLRGSEQAERERLRKALLDMQPMIIRCDCQLSVVGRRSLFRANLEGRRPPAVDSRHDSFGNRDRIRDGGLQKWLGASVPAGEFADRNDARCDQQHAFATFVHLNSQSGEQIKQNLSSFKPNCTHGIIPVGSIFKSSAGIGEVVRARAEPPQLLRSAAS
jgi:hypothetical protein